MKTYTQWVVGFLFKDDGKEVALISKTHPVWQAGKHNGIGGKIDEGETAEQAMRREFLEEAGADVTDWKEFCVLKVQDGEIRFFVSHGDHALQSKTDEKISWYQVAELGRLPIISNLEWLIPLALDENVHNSSIHYFQPH